MTLSRVINTSLRTLYLRVGLRREIPYSRRQPLIHLKVKDGSRMNLCLRRIALTNLFEQMDAWRKAKATGMDV